MPDPHNQPEPTPEERFAQLVREKREALGWSQEELARRVSAATGTTFHQTGITRIEKQARSIRLNEALVLAGVLGIELGPLAQTLNDRVRSEQNLIVTLKASQAVLENLEETAYRIRDEMEVVTARYADTMNRIQATQDNIRRVEHRLALVRAQIEMGEGGNGE